MQSVLSLLGSSLRYLVQQGLELVLVATFITIFIYLQLRESATSITKSQLIEAFPLVSTIKQDIALEYMESGFWPQAQWLSDEYEFVSTQIVQSAYFDGQGGIHLNFTDENPQLAGRTLSFIAAVDKNNPMSSLIWSCGYSNPPGPYQRLAANQTDIAPTLLPASCRNLNKEN